MLPRLPCGSIALRLPLRVATNALGVLQPDLDEKKVSRRGKDSAFRPTGLPMAG
jgi:hypothetical protein